MRDDYRSGILLDNTVDTPELNVYQPLNKSPAIPNSKLAYKPGGGRLSALFRASFAVTSYTKLIPSMNTTFSATASPRPVYHVCDLSLSLSLSLFVLPFPLVSLLASSRFVAITTN